MALPRAAEKHGQALFTGECEAGKTGVVGGHAGEQLYQNTP